MISMFLTAVDAILAGAFPPAVRLWMWGLLGGLAVMLLYRRVSPQGTLVELKGEMKEVQEQLKNFEGEFEEAGPLLKRNLQLALKRLVLVLGPTLLAALPIIILLPWLETRFAWAQPQPGQEITVSAESDSTMVVWQPARNLHWQPAQAAAPIEGGWRVTWPAAGDTLRLFPDGDAILTLPTPHPVMEIRKQSGWNMLYTNPAGYLPPGATVSAIRVALPAATYLPFGPDWLSNWLGVFLLATTISSLGAKFALRIQ